MHTTCPPRRSFVASDARRRGQVCTEAFHTNILIRPVQDAFGGDLICASVQVLKGLAISHFFNLIDGVPIDITRGRFLRGTAIPADAPKEMGFSSTRDYVMSFEATRTRYELLRQRLAGV